MTPKKSRRWSKKSSRVTPETKSPAKNSLAGFTPEAELAPEPKEVDIVSDKTTDIPTAWQDNVKTVESSSDADSRGVSSGKDRFIFGLGIIFVLVIIGVTGGVGYYYKHQQTVVAVAVTPSPTETLTPTPTPELGIVVLNASGVSGAAGKLANQLKVEGIMSVETGNADVVKGNLINLPSGVSLPDNLAAALNKNKFVGFKTGTSSSGKIEIVIVK